MDADSKRKSRERHLKALPKLRTRDEEKRLRELARQKKASRPRQTPRRRHWQADEDDEPDLFERMRAKSPETDGAPPRVAASVPEEPAVGEPATVVFVARGRVRLAPDADAPDDEGDGTLEASLPPELAATQATTVAVGDRVRFVELGEAGEGPYRVTSVEPRRSALSRSDPGKRALERVLAANVDLGVVVVSARTPPFKPGLVDRVALALEAGSVRPFVCVNKIDLVRGEADASERRRIEAALTSFHEAGYPVFRASTVTGEGLDELGAAIRGTTCVFLGHSGVGKSSLLNALDPSSAQTIGAVRASDGKGRHTTTASSLHVLSDGTRVIDTPGVRTFGLWKLGADEVRAAFHEFEAFAGDCRFRDCSHRVEPDCAVRAAVGAGRIARARFASYLRIVASAEEP